VEDRLRTYFVVSFITSFSLGCVTAPAGGGGGADPAVDGSLRARASDGCWAYCESFTACTGDTAWPMEECVAYCETFVGCEAPAEAYYACAVEALSDGCEGLGVCDELHLEAHRCTLRTTSCEESADACSCDGGFLAIDSYVACERLGGSGGGDAGVQCACTWNGELLGTCAQDAMDCGIETSCCVQFYFGVDGG
jgi:hypothetical protein